ncbi:MAG: ATP-dependent DNA ligase [Acidimicrobiales bacterium]|nr:ATP-dependent DNA ligase [Acidimicrobiales bacterium]
MLFVEIARASDELGATSARSDKTALLAELLRGTPVVEVEAVVGFLTGDVRQGRVGVGWRTLQKSAEGTPRSEEAVLTVAEVDSTISELAGLSGPGSANRRNDLLTETFSRATDSEAAFLFRLFGGDLRQGALGGVMTDAVAKASGVPASAVRRAVMFGGRLDLVARIALTDGRTGIDAVGLTVGRAVQPMLASTAQSVSDAVADLGVAAVEWKLDGIRIQVHRDGDEVRVFSRNLNDITTRLPGVVEVALGLDATSLVLDGEALVLGPDGRPVMFQDTAAQVGADREPATARPFFFDLLHVDGVDLVDLPFAQRRERLTALAPAWQVPGEITSEVGRAESVLEEALAAGHEGVVVKGAESRYEAGRRGKTWRKVKPVHTLDLVVLAVEWGYGRRTGWLSNLHLGARTDDDAPSGRDRFVMVGKTFKGLTDELLRWQTERFLELAEHFEHGPEARHGTVTVQPEQVVEIAIDGVQRSTRYPGGVALRFARVVRYRDDKRPGDADHLDSVRAFLPS